ncbi:MAG: MFS transporter [Promethearchaeota archaeon]
MNTSELYELFRHTQKISEDFKVNLKKKKTFQTLFFLYFMIYVFIGILPANIDNLLITLPQTTKMGIGIIITSSLFTGIISVLIFGYVGDKLSYKASRKKLFIVTNLLWIIGYGLFSLSLNYISLLILTVIAAIGTGAFLPIGFSFISDLFPSDKRGSKFGTMQFGMIVGNGTGIIFGAILGTLLNFNGWRLAYGISFFLGVIAILMYVSKAQAPIRKRTEPELANFNVDYNYKITFASIFQLFRIKSIMAIFLAVFCSGIALSTLGNWAIFYLSIKISSSNAEGLATVIYLLVGLGALPGTIIGGKMGDSSLRQGKIRGRIVISITGLISGVSLMMIFYIFPFFTYHSIFVLIFWIIFITLGFIGYCFSYFSMGNQFAIYSEVCIPELRSTANAINGLMLNIGGIMGNLIISSLIQSNLGLLPFAIFSVLAIWLFGSFLWFIAYSQYPKDVLNRRNVLLGRREVLNQQIKSPKLHEVLRA